VQIAATSSGVQLKLRDTTATLDGEAAQNGAIVLKGAMLEVAGVRFQLIRTRSSSGSGP